MAAQADLRLFLAQEGACVEIEGIPLPSKITFPGSGR